MHALLTTVHVPETWMKEHLPVNQNNKHNRFGQKCLHKSTESILIPESDQGKTLPGTSLMGLPTPGVAQQTLWLCTFQPLGGVDGEYFWGIWN